MAKPREQAVLKRGRSDHRPWNTRTAHANLDRFRQVGKSTAAAGLGRIGKAVAEYLDGGGITATIGSGDSRAWVSRVAGSEPKGKAQ
jgi:lactate dehydrogenase-like 2-hydroxyacid dehydrogenase